jgi:hypothetical protein
MIAGARVRGGQLDGAGRGVAGQSGGCGLRGQMRGVGQPGRSIIPSENRAAERPEGTPAGVWREPSTAEPAGGVGIVGVSVSGRARAWGGAAGGAGQGGVCRGVGSVGRRRRAIGGSVVGQGATRAGRRRGNGRVVRGAGLARGWRVSRDVGAGMVSGQAGVKVKTQVSNGVMR